MRSQSYLSCKNSHRRASLPSTKSSDKGRPNKKISQIFLWDGHLARPNIGDGQDAHPTKWIIYFLESPNTKTLVETAIYRVSLENPKILPVAIHEIGLR
jgi:hypothetical protein